MTIAESFLGGLVVLIFVLMALPDFLRWKHGRTEKNPNGTWKDS